MIFGVFLIGLFLAGCSSSTPTGKTVQETNNEVSTSSLADSNPYFRIPISEVSTMMNKKSYNADGVMVNFFAVKGTDGQIRTAFDACDVCGGSKGYRQQGTDVICNNCGRNFKIDDLGTKNVGGGCWPSALTHRVEGSEILINKDDLAFGSFRFA